MLIAMLPCPLVRRSFSVCIKVPAGGGDQDAIATIPRPRRLRSNHPCSGTSTSMSSEADAAAAIAALFDTLYVASSFCATQYGQVLLTPPNRYTGDYCVVAASGASISAQLRPGPHELAI